MEYPDTEKRGGEEDVMEDIGCWSKKKATTFTIFLFSSMGLLQVTRLKYCVKIFLKSFHKVFRSF